MLIYNTIILPPNIRSAQREREGELAFWRVQYLKITHTVLKLLHDTYTFKIIAPNRGNLSHPPWDWT
jgi:hypothetical protein